MVGARVVGLDLFVHRKDRLGETVTNTKPKQGTLMGMQSYDRHTIKITLDSLLGSD